MKLKPFELSAKEVKRIAEKRLVYEIAFFYSLGRT